MLSIRSLLVLGLPLLPLCVAQPRQTPTPRNDDSDVPLFDKLIDWLPEESVKDALTDALPKYRDGVFEHGKEALQRIKHESPDLATRLVDHALHMEMEKQDLRKRQASSSNTTVTSTSSNTPTTSSTEGASTVTTTTTLFVSGSTIVEVINDLSTVTVELVVGTSTVIGMPCACVMFALFLSVK